MKESFNQWKVVSEVSRQPVKMALNAAGAAVAAIIQSTMGVDVDMEATVVMADMVATAAGVAGEADMEA